MSSAQPAAPPLVAQPALHSARGSWVRQQATWLQVTLRIARNPMGAFGLFTLVLLVFLAVFAPLIAPYSPIVQHPGLELRQVKEVAAINRQIFNLLGSDHALYGGLFRVHGYSRAGDLDDFR